MSDPTTLKDLLQFPIIETLVDILLCTVPIWVAILIGLIIGWSWKPRWSGLLFLGFRTKFRFLWTFPTPPGFGVRRLWLAFTALSAFSVLKTLFSSFYPSNKHPHVSASLGQEQGHPPTAANTSRISDAPLEAEYDVVTEKDLEHLLQLLEGKGEEAYWQSLMEHTTSNMSYQAWRHEPENGPTIYRSRTVFEDATTELVRDFFWDDEFRPKWDRMLTYFKILEDCSYTGMLIVHWIKKFPFFCSDREYIIGRRIWEAGKTYYCITKGVPYPSLPKRDKPRRVERYFSSWVIKPAKSLKDGSMTACEVCLVHYEDMGIPKDVAKLGVRHGMWDAVKKLHAGMRAYQNAPKAELSRSRCALMASITTKISFDGDDLPSGAFGEEGRRTSDSRQCRKHSVDMKWVLIGGTVAVICGLQTGFLRKVLMIGARKKFLGN